MSDHSTAFVVPIDISFFVSWNVGHSHSLESKVNDRRFDL